MRSTTKLHSFVLSVVNLVTLILSETAGHDNLGYNNLSEEFDLPDFQIINASALPPSLKYDVTF